MRALTFTAAFFMGYAAARLHEQVHRFVKGEARQAAERAAEVWFGRKLRKAAERQKPKGGRAPGAGR